MPLCDAGAGFRALKCRFGYAELKVQSASAGLATPS